MVKTLISRKNEKVCSQRATWGCDTIGLHETLALGVGGRFSSMKVEQSIGEYPMVGAYGNVVLVGYYIRSTTWWVNGVLFM